MEEFIKDWSYLGVFVGIVATGMGFPMPEELPVVLGGALVGTGTDRGPIWFLMLPVCILGVVVGDSVLYGIGWLCGNWLVEKEFVKKHLLSPGRLEEIRENFKKHGVKILLFARLTPGIRAAVFLTAGITRLPMYLFLFADGVYAIPGVSLLFFLGWYFTDTMVSLIEDGRWHRILVLVALLGVVGYFVYRFMRAPTVVGDPKDVPTLAQPVQHTIEQLSKIIRPAEKDSTAQVKDSTAQVEQK